MDSIAGRIAANHSRPGGVQLKASDVRVRGLIDGHAGAAVKADKQDLELVVIATTDAVDNDREVVLPGGADRSYFEANKSIFVDHRYDVASWIGTMRKTMPYPAAGDGQRGWKVRMRLRDTALGRDLYRATQEGYGPGASIGFVPTDYGPPTEDERARYGDASAIVRKWRWLELSLTAMPCNVACQMIGVADDAETIAADRAERLQRAVSTGTIQPESAYLLGLPAPDARKSSGLRIAEVLPGGVVVYRSGPVCRPGDN